MFPFSIERLVINSPTHQKGRILKLHPSVTVLTGDNATGKSSALKSIFYAFGAQPKMQRQWREAVAQVLVHFTVENRKFSVLRTNESITVFDETKTPLVSGTSVTNVIGPYLGKLFRFGLKMSARDGDIITPPPAFLFLPFYFDQDTSWTEAWNGFSNLQQLKNWRRDLIEYHVGLKPNEYYEVKGKHTQTKAELEEAQSENRVLKGVREELSRQYQEVSFQIDLDAFQEEVKELLVHCGALQKEADKIQTKLVELYNARMHVESQIVIVEKTLGEINADLSFLASGSEHIDCPTCGAEYEAGFTEVFDIARDEGTCHVLLQKLKDDLYKIVSDIEQNTATHNEQNIEVARVRAILEKRREEVKLKDLIDSESKKQLKSVLEENVKKANDKTFEIQGRINRLKTQLDSFTSKDKREAISNEFTEYMNQHVIELALLGMTEKDRTNYLGKISAQGSDQPRALLAYCFAILKIIRHRSSSAFCPIIIDSPIQQEQDQDNHVRILNFIRNNQPSGAQLILGVVDTKGVEFGGDTIVLREKRGLLQRREYDEANEEISEYARRALRFGTGESSLF